MTCAVFEAHVHEMERIKALKALMEADIVMLPHVSNYARKKWFEGITKTLLPLMAGKETITFNGRKVGFKQLKRAFSGIVKKYKGQVEDVA